MASSLPLLPLLSWRAATPALPVKDLANKATAAMNIVMPTPCGTPPAPTASDSRLSSMPRAAAT